MKVSKISTCLSMILATGGVFAAGCSTAPKTGPEKQALQARSTGALETMKAKDPQLETLVNRAYAYAIFPSVSKAAFGVGGGYGRGDVYEQGRLVGYADITQGTAGLQAGVQDFAELILFQNNEALDRFKYGKIKFAANASAVALKAGASTSANYSAGVLVFTLPNGGLMFEAAIGGQEFGFVPVNSAGNNGTAASGSEASVKSMVNSTTQPSNP